MNKEAVHDESFASLVTSLKDDFVRLVDAEKALAREEILLKVKEVRRELVMLASAAVLAGVFLLCLVTAAILALSRVVAPSLAALIVGGSLGLVSVFLLLGFRSRNKDFDAVPRESIASVKRDVHAVREAVR